MVPSSFEQSWQCWRGGSANRVYRGQLEGRLKLYRARFLIQAFLHLLERGVSHHSRDYQPHDICG